LSAAPTACLVLQLCTCCCEASPLPALTQRSEEANRQCQALLTSWPTILHYHMFLLL
jgi:hypothetical protein